MPKDQYDKIDKIQRALSRPVRLVLWTLFFGLVFFKARGLFMLAVAAFAFFGGIKRRKQGTGWISALVAVAAICIFIVQMTAYLQAAKYKEFIAKNTPVDISAFEDGVYTGKGEGVNGSIELGVNVENGKIAGIEILRSREAVYAFDDALKNAIGKTDTDLLTLPGFVFRNNRSLNGFAAAVENAFIGKLPNKPEFGKYEKAAMFLSANKLGRVAINTTAILFIVIITFEFFLQPTLAKGTGQSLNCYNCQACVGACPVKMVAGEPFPMIMVIEARAGNYEKVAQLAKYCVGCGKCAAKCPVGNSGPSVASSSYLLWKQDIAREKRREMARLRGWPTLDQLSREQDEKS